MKQNDLEKVLMVIALKRRHGDSVIHCVDKAIAFNTYYASRGFDIYVTSKFIAFTRKVSILRSESVLILDVKTGRVVIDALGFFGAPKTINDLEKQVVGSSL